jgi:hypothetical protein
VKKCEHLTKAEEARERIRQDLYYMGYGNNGEVDTLFDELTKHFENRIKNIQAGVPEDERWERLGTPEELGLGEFP